MNDFVAYPSRGRIALLVLASILFVAGGAWMAGLVGDPPTSSRYSPMMVTVTGWASILLFGLCGAMLAKRLFDTSEQLRIDAMGIRWALWSDRTIPWQDITDVTTWGHAGQKTIVLHLRDPARYPGSGALARLNAANRAVTGGDIPISLTGTDRSYDEAMQAIARFRR